MLLQWEIDRKKYHFFDLYKMCGSYICIDLMVDKQSKMIIDNSLSVTNVEYLKFNQIKFLPLKQGKRLMLDCVLANSDHLINDPLHVALNRETLKQDILNITETFIQYKITEGLQRDADDPKKCDIQTASTLTNDPLAPDEKIL